MDIYEQETRIPFEMQDGRMIIHATSYIDHNTLKISNSQRLSVKEIVLPKELTNIGVAAFKGYENLLSINIPKGVEKISMAAFQNCSSLKTMRLPEGVTKIGPLAFMDCPNLKEIFISKSVQEIDSTAFDAGCKTKICCEKGTYAEKFAKENSFRVRTEEKDLGR